MEGEAGLITTMVGNYPKISPDARAPSLRTAINRYDEGRISLDRTCVALRRRSRVR